MRPTDLCWRRKFQINFENPKPLKEGGKDVVQWEKETSVRSRTF